MHIKVELKNFYNQESKKYSSTRKKHRLEADLLLKLLDENENKTIKILELGCGGGRLLENLNKSKKQIIYTGVDISDKLIEISKKISSKNIKSDFICDDMTNYVNTTKQEQYDFIICIASFQHIPTRKERIFLMKNFYRSLKYNGKIIMINRSFSKRFVFKYWREIIKNFFINIIKIGNISIKDNYIPRKSNGKVFNRYYHIFTIKELKNLAQLSGFTIEKLCYLDNKGVESSKIINAKNTLLIASKNIGN